MYSIVGFVCNSDTVCCGCMEEELTAEEMDILYGRPYAGDWVKIPVKHGWDDYERNPATDEIEYQEVRYNRKKHKVLDAEGCEITPITDGDEWIDGCYCDCGNEIIEPYKLECAGWGCSNTVETGYEALKLERKYDKFYCAECVKKAMEDIRKAVYDEITKRAPYTGDRRYEYIRCRQIVEKAAHVVDAQSAIQKELDKAVKGGWFRKLSIDVDVWAECLEILNTAIEENDINADYTVDQLEEKKNEQGETIYAA